MTNLFGEPDPATAKTESYRVLARKYRPAVFADLIGQEVLVRTLSNAIKSGRLAHAFLLTGIRGVGKTTTARIIARGLNCIGADGNGQPTTSPCGTCANCQMIADDRHMDVIEMDAASRTGVGDIRELIDTVHYLPTTARYKIYIIDEVHMLSNNAFNALLKTLEEPPPHVKFIFATTETRKIPVTILSRCQRFDLKRVDIETLSVHLQRIVDKENVKADTDALQLIASAAEGSVRDALSLLDQAIAHSAAAEEGAAQQVTCAMVRSMLGMIDKSQNFTLLEALLSGKIVEALAQFNALYASGADPVLIIQDLLEITHFITRIKLTRDAANDITYSETDRTQATALADKLSISVLGRTWQMLLKGLNEVKYAPHPVQAAEMVLVRIAHVKDLPTPQELLKQLQNGTSNTTARAAATTPPVINAPVMAVPSPRSAYAAPVASGSLALVSAQHTAPTPMLTLAVSDTLAKVTNYEEVVALFAKQREALLHSQLRSEASLVSFEQGRIELRLTPRVAADFAAKAGKLLSQWTGENWAIIASDRQGEATLAAQETQAAQQAIAAASQHPTIKAILDHFPDARVTSVKPLPQE